MKWATAFFVFFFFAIVANGGEYWNPAQEMMKQKNYRTGKKKVSPAIEIDTSNVSLDKEKEEAPLPKKGRGVILTMPEEENEETNEDLSDIPLTTDIPLISEIAPETNASGKYTEEAPVLPTTTITKITPAYEDGEVGKTSISTLPFEKLVSPVEKKYEKFEDEYFELKISLRLSSILFKRITGATGSNYNATKAEEVLRSLPPPPGAKSPARHLKSAFDPHIILHYIDLLKSIKEFQKYYETRMRAINAKQERVRQVLNGKGVDDNIPLLMKLDVARKAIQKELNSLNNALDTWNVSLKTENKVLLEAQNKANEEF